MKLNRAQFIFLMVISILFAYLISGFVLLYLNGYGFKETMDYYNLALPANAMLTNYPRAYEAFIYSFLPIASILFLIPLIPKKEKLHGDARFANQAEINKMKLSGDDGIIIGKSGSHLLRYPGENSVSLAAETGAGKGVSVVIPNLLEWKESAVVMDIKNENFTITSKYRQQVLKQDVYFFNPFSMDTDRYNPLTYVDMNDELQRDIQLNDIANMLYPLGASETINYFNSLAQSLFIGVCYLYKDLSTNNEAKAILTDINFELSFTLPGILDIEKNLNIDYEEDGKKQSITDFNDVVAYFDYMDIVSEETKKRLNPYMTMQSDKERGSVESTFIRPLLFYQNTVIKNATSTSDFDLRDLRKKRMTIYLAITPDQLENAKPILNIFWSQLISLNTKELPENNPSLKYHVLLLMDEFTSIGYMPILHTSVSFIRGYWLRLLIIYQNKSQLEEPTPRGYGKDGAKTMLSNMKCNIYFAQNEIVDAEQLSKILGDKTLKHTSRSFSSAKGGGSRSRNVNEVKRSLMLPQEIQVLDDKKEIITITSFRPIFCNKAFYYNDSYFMNKLKMVSPTLKKVKGIPNREQLNQAMQNNELSIQRRSI